MPEIQWTEIHPKLGRTPRAWLEEYGPDYYAIDLVAFWKKETGETTTKKAIQTARERYNIAYVRDRPVSQAPLPPKPSKEEPVAYQGISPDRMLKLLKDKPTPLSALSREFDRSEETIKDVIAEMRGDGYAIVEVPSGVEIPTKRELPRPQLTPLFEELGGKFLFAHVTDTHQGSIGCQMTSFNRFVDEAYRIGVRHILHSGDVTAGVSNYTEQNYELYAHGADEQRECVLRDYPRKEGLFYYLIGGNHDFTYIKCSGYDVVKAICKERDDFIYAGFHQADVPLTDQITARLWHPIGGIPYASSYRLQKGVEQMVLEEYMKAVMQEENPTLRFVLAGHLHIKIWAGIGPIEGFHGGCFEGWTSYLKRKALAPNRGGWIIEVTLDKRGRPQRVRGEFIDFPEMEDDYKRWHIPHAAETEKPNINPLFEYQEEKGGDKG